MHDEERKLIGKGSIDDPQEQSDVDDLESIYNGSDDTSDTDDFCDTDISIYDLESDDSTFKLPQLNTYKSSYDDKALGDVVKQRISSKKVSSLISPIFASKVVSKDEELRLFERLSTHNIDKRDARTKIVKQWIDDISLDESKKVEVDKALFNIGNNINFFEDTVLDAWLDNYPDDEAKDTYGKATYAMRIRLAALDDALSEEYKDFLNKKADEIFSTKSPITTECFYLLAQYEMEFKKEESIRRTTALIKKAKEKLEGAPHLLNFDPQGRVLVDVEDSNSKTGYTLVSFDIKTEPNLYELYQEAVKEKLLVELTVHKKTGGQFVDEEEVDRILYSLDSLKSKSSIISLQQEIQLQTSLAARLYLKYFQKKPEMSVCLVDKAHKEATREINDLVLKAFAKALKAGYEEGKELDISKVNEVLAAFRDEITKQAHDILLKHISNETKIELSPEEFDAVSAKKMAEKLTASSYSVLHTDTDTKLAVLIEGPDITAHDRKTGILFAHRSIDAYRLNDNNEVLTKIERVRVRTNSLPVKTGLTEKQCVDDVKIKLGELEIDYKLYGTFTYNLLTALLDNADDALTSNAQTKSTKHILLGAHAHNRDIQSSSLCLVQAISVNRRGRPLGYHNIGWRVGLSNEATLMAEMSLFSNVLDNNDDLMSQYKKLMSQYKKFLKLEPTTTLYQKIKSYFKSEFFSKTSEGILAKSLIKAQKKEWQNETSEVDENDTPKLAKLALRKIMAYDLHFSHDYAKLIQSLSLYVEKQAVFGCKSGNERTPIIAERAGLLDIEPLDQRLKDAFKTLAMASTKDRAKLAANSLKKMLNIVYNEQAVYGATTMIPLLDQGGGHKIKAATGSMLDTTDYAEDADITNLQQQGTKKMQAHNGLVDYMKRALENQRVNELTASGGVAHGQGKSTTRMYKLMNQNPKGVRGCGTDDNSDGIRNCKQTKIATGADPGTDPGTDPVIGAESFVESDFLEGVESDFLEGVESVQFNHHL